jgi:hypothetical protein
MGESVYLNDNAFVEAILYDKKNGYFPLFFISEERMFFLRLESVRFLNKIVSLVKHVRLHGIFTQGQMLI